MVKTLEQVLELKETSQDVFETQTHPIWSWPGTKVFPGGTLMAQAVAAAFKTIGSDFAIDNVQAYFVAGANPDVALYYKVHRLSDGGRFAIRNVIGEQNGTAMIQVTCTFVRASAMKGPSMIHSVTREGTETIKSITLDDLELATNDYGPYMKFQRLPLVKIDSGAESTPENLLYTSAAMVSPPIKISTAKMHALGIIALSDYHVLDAAPTLHGRTFHLPRIGDTTRTPTKMDFERYTSLNHNIHFHVYDDFQSDALCYIEVRSPWANERRAEMQSRIFGRSGKLIATCKQEAYYVLKDDSRSSKL